MTYADDLSEAIQNLPVIAAVQQLFDLAGCGITTDWPAIDEPCGIRGFRRQIAGS